MTLSSDLQTNDALRGRLSIDHIMPGTDMPSLLMILITNAI